MLELILTIAVPTLTMIIGLVILWRKIPELMQQAINDIGKQLKKTFGDPNVKRAMSILGSQSGESRADNALREKAADAIVSQSPMIGMVLEQFGISALDGLKLMNDPLFQPLIQKFLAGQGMGSNEGGLP